MKAMTVAELKTHFSEVLVQVKNGNSVKVLYGKSKKPVALITPIKNSNSPRKIGTLDGKASLKTRMKKYSFKNVAIHDFPQYAKDMDFTIIDMQENEAITFHHLALKENHKDPFDRMLIWQAITKKMIMISKDTLFKQYKADGLRLV